MGDGVANSQLRDLNVRLLGERSKDPAWDSARALVAAAISTTNGSEDKIKDMAETQGLLIHFLIQEKERAPSPLGRDELKKVMIEVHNEAFCPWSETIVTDADGRRRIDLNKFKTFTKSVADSQDGGAADAGSADAKDSIVVTPFGIKIMEFRGRENVRAVRNAILKYAALAALAWLMLTYAVDRNNDRMKTERVRDFVSVLKASGVVPQAVPAGAPAYEAEAGDTP